MRYQLWIGLRQAATLLGIREHSLRRWTDRGFIPHRTTGGGHRQYNLSDLEKYGEVIQIICHLKLFRKDQAEAKAHG